MMSDMSTDPMELYRRATTEAVAFDLSSFGKLVLRGKDAGSFLQSFTTNDVVKPGPGSGCEAFVLTAQAKVLAWVRVAIGLDELYLHCDPGLETRLRGHLEKHQIGEVLTIEDQTEVETLWHLCGPGLAAKLRPLGLTLGNLSPWQHVEHEFFGRVQRCDFVGLPGVFVTNRASSVDGWAHWCAAEKILASTLHDEAWTMLRVEAGTPQYGIDFDDTNLPQEINRTEQAISFTKGCYLGQETVARIRAYGRVNKQLVPIKFPTMQEPDWPALSSWYGTALNAGDKEVGRVKTVAYSPKLTCWLAFATLRREHVTVGTALTAVHSTGQTAPVEVTLWPSAAGAPGT
jgi:tRNA-modifying protein YgfZ